MEDSGTVHLGLVPLTFVVWTCHLLNLLRVAVQPHPELFSPEDSSTLGHLEDLQYTLAQYGKRQGKMNSGSEMPKCD